MSLPRRVDESTRATRATPQPAPSDAEIEAWGQDMGNREVSLNAYLADLTDRGVALMRRATPQPAPSVAATEAERDRLRGVIDDCAKEWLRIDGIPFQGGIDGAMRAAVDEIARLRAERDRLQAEVVELRQLRCAVPGGVSKEAVASLVGFCSVRGCYKPAGHDGPHTPTLPPV